MRMHTHTHTHTVSQESRHPSGEIGGIKLRTLSLLYSQHHIYAIYLHFVPFLFTMSPEVPPLIRNPLDARQGRWRDTAQYQ